MVKFIYRQHTWEVKAGMTVDSALKKLEIDPEAVLPTIKDTLVTTDYVLKEGETVKLVAVISGGCQRILGTPSARGERLMVCKEF